MVSRTDGTGQTDAASRDAKQPVSAPGLVIRHLADIDAERVTWLWPDRIPRGKVTIFCGDPENFKTGVLLDVASRVSAGRAWPDRLGDTNPPGDVFIITGEDGIADTIRPRMDAAKADVSRVDIVEDACDPKSGDIQPFTLDDHLHRLDRAFEGRNVRMLAIDPLDAFLGRRDSHKNAEVRAVTSQLAHFAERHGCAVVCVMHLNKQYGGTALKRITGSVAFGAAARVVWIFGKDRDDPSRLLMLCAKMNIAPKPDGLAYEIGTKEVPKIGQQPYVSWSPDPVHTTADEILAAVTLTTTKLDEAKEFVRDALAAGPIPSNELERLATDAGIAPTTLGRARKELKIASDKAKVQTHGEWMVSLPSAPHRNVGGVDGVGEVGGDEDPQDRQDRQGRQGVTLADNGDDGLVG